MTLSRSAAALCGVIDLAMLGVLPATANDASLPGGATSLNEAHGDWTVV